MESFFIFIIAVVINTIFKSIGDKKKIEEARRKRVEELKKGERHTSGGRSKLDNFEDRIKRWNDELKKYQAEDRPNEFEDKNLQAIKDVELVNDEAHMPKFISYVEMIEKEEQKEQKEQDKDLVDTKKRQSKLDKELLNAVIWSEILAEPKSIQRMKKGI